MADYQHQTNTVPKLEFYQPGLSLLKTILTHSTLTTPEIDSLLSYMDSKNILFGVMALTRNTGNTSNDFAYLLKIAFNLVAYQADILADTAKTAKLKISEISNQPTQINELYGNFDNEYTKEETDNPENYKDNSFVEYIKKNTEETINKYFKKFHTSGVGKKVSEFEESAPLINTATTPTTVGLTIAGGVIGGTIPTITSTALAATIASRATTAAEVDVIVGFKISSNLAIQNVSPVLLSSNLLKDITSLVEQPLLGTASSGLKYYSLTPKGYLVSKTNSPMGIQLRKIYSTPGVEENIIIATNPTAKAFTTTTVKVSTSTAGKAAGTAAAKVGTQAALTTGTTEAGTVVGGPMGFIVGAALGFVVSKIPEIWRWMKENIGPVLGTTIGLALFGFTGSLPVAAASGLTIAGAAYGIKGITTTGASSMGNRMGIIFTSIASNITTISITPIIVAVLCLPILIAFFMIIINSGAYVVPPAGRHSGPGGLYPSCWPLDTGVITQLPPHGLTQRLDAFDIGTNQQNGIPVYATHDGTVHNFTDPNTPSQGSYGTYVKVVSDEGFCTLYGHLASHSRSEGETVFAGDEIGLSDNTGTSTGPHLHYEYQEPCTSYAGVIPGSTLITNYVPPGYTLGGSIQYSGSCFASQQGGSATAP